MRVFRLSRIALTALAIVGLAACSDSTAPAGMTDTSLAADLAASAGDAIATDVTEMIGNEQFGGFASAALAGAGRDSGQCAPPRQRRG